MDAHGIAAGDGQLAVTRKVEREQLGARVEDFPLVFLALILAALAETGRTRRKVATGRVIRTGGLRDMSKTLEVAKGGDRKRFGRFRRGTPNPYT